MTNYERLQQLLKAGDNSVLSELVSQAFRRHDVNVLLSLAETHFSQLITHPHFDSVVSLCRNRPEFRTSARNYCLSNHLVSYHRTKPSSYARSLEQLATADQDESLPLQPLCEYNGEMRVRPPTFWEVSSASVDCPELLNHYYDTFTGVAYSKDSADIIILPECHGFFALTPKDRFLRLKEGEFNSLRSQGYVMTRAEVENNPEQAWLYALEEKKDLLNDSKQLLVSKRYSSDLHFWLLSLSSVQEDQVRALWVGSPTSSYAGADFDLSSSIYVAFLRVSPDRFRPQGGHEY